MNNFPISVSEIATGMTNASSSLAAAGNSFDESVALLTAANTSMQDAAKSSTGLRTIVARMRNMTTELDDLGETMSTADYDEIVQALTSIETASGDKISVSLTDANGELRNTYDVLSDIADVWDQMSSNDQASLAETLAGTRQQAVFFSLMNNFKEATGAMDAMEGSAGALSSAYDTYLDSTEAHIKSFQAAVAQLGSDMFDSDSLKDFIDLGTDLINMADGVSKFVESIGGLKMVLADIGALLAATYLENITSFGKGILTSFQGVGEVLGDVLAGTQSVSGAFEALGASASTGQIAILGLAAAVTLFSAALSAVDKYNENKLNSKIDVGEQALSDAQSLQEAVSSYDNIKSAYAEGTASAEEFEDAQNSLISAVESAGGSIDGATNSTQSFNSATSATSGSTASASGGVESLASSYENLSEKVEKAANSLLRTKITEASSGIDAQLQKSYGNLAGMLDFGDEDVGNRIDAMINKFNDVKSRMESIQSTNSDYSNDETWQTLHDEYSVMYSELQGAIEDADSINELLGEYYGNAMDSDNIDNLSEYMEAREKLISSLEGDDDFQSYGSKSAGDIADDILAQKENLSELSDEYQDYAKLKAFLADQDKDNVEDVLDYYQKASTKTKKIMTSIANSNGKAASWSLKQWKDAIASYIPSVEDAASAVESLKTKISEFADYQSNLVSAINDSRSATGLTTDEMENLMDTFKDYGDYDPAKLFEETANGIHLNEEELSKLNSEKAISGLKEQMEAIEDIKKSIYAARAKGEDTSELESELTTAKLLKSEYEGMLSAYNAWETAKSSTDDNEGYANIAEAYSDMQEKITQGWYGNDDLNSYLDLILGKANRTSDVVADFDKLTQTIEGTNHSLMDYFQYDDDNNLVSDGLFDFLDDVNAKLGDEYAKMDENGEYSFDFDGDKLQDVADAFGISTEMVEQFERAMKEAGFAVDLSDEDILDSIQKEQDSLKELQNTYDNLGIGDLDLDFNADTDSLDDLWDTIQDLEDADAKIDVEAEGGAEAKEQLDALIEDTKEQYYFRLNAETDGSLDLAASYVEQIKELINSDNQLHIDVTGDDRITAVAQEIADLPTETQTAIGVEEVGDVNGILSQLQSAPDSINVPVSATSDGSLESSESKLQEIDSFTIGDKTFTISATDEASSTLSTIQGLLSGINSKTITVTTNYVSTGEKPSKASGTFSAHAGGSFNAYDKGTDVTIGQDETSLVNELGNESIVRNGKWQIIEGGAHMMSLKRGDIIFNAKQTEELIKNGYVTSNGGRGALAYYAGSMNAYDSGSGGRRRSGSTSTYNAAGAYVSSGASSYSYGSSSSYGNSGTDDDDSTDVVDWIEIAIDRIETAIDNLSNIVKSAYVTLADKLTAANKEISQVQYEMELQQSAYNRYIQQANNVGLSGDLATKVQNGTIDITEYDQDTVDKINDYKEWYFTCPFIWRHMNRSAEENWKAEMLIRVEVSA